MSERQNPEVSAVRESAKTILIVEDDQIMGAFYVEAIKQETPYQALLASDSFQALEILLSLKPDLLLLDYSLPYMNGLELYDALQSIKEFQPIPVLLVSAHFPLQEVKKRNLPSLKKPIELDELLKTINTFLA